MNIYIYTYTYTCDIHIYQVTPTAVLRGGTLPYMPPELISNPDAKPSPAVDIFAFGKLLVDMTTRRYSASKSDNEIVAQTLLEKWTWVITMCLDGDPLNRPTAAAIHAELWGGTPHVMHDYEPLMCNSTYLSTLMTKESVSTENATISPPSTLLSRGRKIIDVAPCSAEILAEMLLSTRNSWSPQMSSTLSAAIKLCMNDTRGKVLVLIGEQEAFKSVFCDVDDEDAEVVAITAPTMWSADGGK